MRLLKKLALVLSAAMIVTLIPCKQANAATPAKLALQSATSSSQCLTEYSMNVGQSVDFKFYGVSDYKTTGIGWQSSNKSVATVDKNGVVTAKGVGSAAIIYMATGHASIPMTVVVKPNNTSEYSVKLADQISGKTYTSYNFDKIGTVHDFKFVGAAGWNEQKHLLSATWASTNEAVATVDSQGIVTSRGEGTCQIVLTIINKKNGTVAYKVQPMTVVVNTKKATPTPTPTKKPAATATPTPQASSFVVKQTAYNKATVTFKDKTITNSKVSLAVEGGTNYAMVSNIKDGVGELTFSLPLNDGQEYTITNGTDKYTFKASVGTVSRVGIEYKCNGVVGAAYENSEVAITAKCYDANGIEVQGTITLTETDEWGENTLYDKTVYMGDVGTRKTITAKTVTATGQEIKSTAVLTAQKIPAYAITAVQAAVVNVGQKFSDGKGTALALGNGDEGKAIAFKITDNRGNVFEPVAGASSFDVEEGYFEITSTKPDVADVDSDGTIVTYKQGTTQVLVSFYGYEKGTSTRVATLDLTVRAASYINNGTVTAKDNSSRIISSIPGADNYNDITLVYKLTDQYGTTVIPETYSYVAKVGNDEVDWFSETWNVDEEKGTVSLTLSFTARSEFDDTIAYKTVNIVPSFEYNTMFYDKEFNKPTVSIKIINFDKTHTPVYEVVAGKESVSTLGAAAGDGDLFVSAMLVEKYQSAYGDAKAINGAWALGGTALTASPSQAELTTLTGGGDGGVYYDVKVTGTTGTSTAYNGIKNEAPSPIAGGVKVKVRNAMSGTMSDVAAAFSKLGTVTVTINFREVYKDGTTYRVRKLGSEKKWTLTGSSAVSSATVTLGSDKTADSVPEDTDFGSWMSWLETHAVITINNGTNGEKIVISQEGDFAKYGVVAEVKAKKKVPTTATGKTYSNLSSVILYFEAEKGNGGWIKLTCTPANNGAIYEKEY